MICEILTNEAFTSGHDIYVHFCKNKLTEGSLKQISLQIIGSLAHFSVVNVTSLATMLLDVVIYHIKVSLPLAFPSSLDIFMVL